MEATIKDIGETSYLICRALNDPVYVELLTKELIIITSQIKGRVSNSYIINTLLDKSKEHGLDDDEAVAIGVVGTMILMKSKNYGKQD